jgi:hypothetical protein
VYNQKIIIPLKKTKTHATYVGPRPPSSLADPVICTGFPSPPPYPLISIEHAQNYFPVSLGFFVGFILCVGSLYIQVKMVTDFEQKLQSS